MRFIALLILVVCFLSNVFGNFEDHLKPIKDKGTHHYIRNIDFIYMINLDKRPEKWKLSNDQLNPYGIYPYRFSAVDGWTLSVEDINDIGLTFQPRMQGGFMATSYHTLKPSHEIIKNYGQTYFCHCFARGTMGIVLSHLSVLADAYDSGYETIWVMEDDIEVLRDPRIIPDLINELDDLVGKGGWDILFTDRDIRDSKGNYTPCYQAARRPDFYGRCNNYAERVSIGSFCKIGARYGATSMIIRRSGIEKLLQFYREHDVFLPYDMDNYLPIGINLFTIPDSIISNLADAISDNGVNNSPKK